MLASRDGQPRVYVTGASGALGFDLFHALGQTHGLPALAVVRRPFAELAAPDEAVRLSPDFFSGDWLDPEDSDATIVHCAGLANPRVQFADFQEMHRLEVEPHLHLVRQLCAGGWRGRMIYVSSGGTVYGEALRLPIDEEHPTEPKGFYGWHKLRIEQGLTRLSAEHGFELLILRVSNPYGMSRMKPDQGVIPILIQTLLEDREFSIYGDGTAERDYLEISDLSRAMARCVTLPGIGSPARIYNIGSGEGVSLNALIEMLTQTLGRPLRMRRQPALQDVQSNVLCRQRAARELDWEPQVPLTRGLSALLARMGAHEAGQRAASSRL